MEGRLQTRSWDGNDGQKHYRTEVVAERVLFLDRMPGTAGMPEDHNGEGVGAGALEPEDIPFE